MLGKDLIMQTLLGSGSGGGASGGGGWPEVPDDGATYVFITLQEGRTSPMLGVGVKGTVTVDWGDGTEPDVLTGTSVYSTKYTPSHAYANPGNYVIRISADGQIALTGTNTSGGSGSTLLRATTGYGFMNYVYNAAICKVIVGANATIQAHAFYELRNLVSCIIREPLNGNDNVFNSTFCWCTLLNSLTLPFSVSDIGNTTFANCNALRFVDLTACTEVPTLANKNAFNNVSTDCEIRVPAALYDEWIAATNWATYASQIKAY